MTRGRSETARPAGPRRGRGTLIALIAVFVAPLLGAYLWWSVPALRPAGRTNHGDLIAPARPLRVEGLVTADGVPFGMAQLQSKWTLVYFGRGACESACRANLYNMRQFRIALGKNAGRVQGVYVTGEPSDANAAAAAREFPPTMVVTGPDAAVEGLRAQFATDAATPLEGEHRLYLIDPLGNLMMGFRQSLEPALVLEDLKRLLRASRVG